MPQVIERGWVSKAPRLRHVAPFDGIRGFGVIGVMAGHALPDATLSFSAIVDVFFVISGFLITTLLLQEHRDTGRVDVRKFYARRILRLLPALYVMLAGSVVDYPLRVPSLACVAVLFAATMFRRRVAD